MLGGAWENGTSAYIKRGITDYVPQWDGNTCIQCNRCAMACPHAAIRPVLLSEAEKDQAPASFETVPARGLGKDVPAYSFRMQISPYDCLGCGVCLTVCPAAGKGALRMKPFEEQTGQQENFDKFAMNDAYLKKEVVNNKSVKNLQFAKPYFQFSAACAGCAETTYIKLVSQEDNAEFAFGYFHAQDSIRKDLLARMERLRANGVAAEAVNAYLDGWNDGDRSRAVSDGLIAALEKAVQTEDTAYILNNREYLAKKSIWAIGGDGWAYDIGFGGIDHAGLCRPTLKIVEYRFPRSASAVPHGQPRRNRNDAGSIMAAGRRRKGREELISTGDS